MLIYANLLRLYRIWVKRLIIITITSCRRAAATICLRPPCELTISSYLFARWHLFRHVGYLRHQQQVDLWPFDLESGVRVTCNVGYLCADFSLPRPLCSRVRPDVRHRQKDRRQTKTSLNASTLWSVRRVGRHNIPLPFALVTWTAFQSCRLGGHRTSQCGSSCSTRRGNLRFVGLPVHNIIWLIFGHGIYPSDDLDLWPWSWCGMVNRATDNLLANFGVSATFRCRVMGKHASHWRHDLITLTFDLWRQRSRLRSCRHRACRWCGSSYSSLHQVWSSSVSPFKTLAHFPSQH